MVKYNGNFGASNHVEHKLKEYGSQGREGNREDHAKSSGRLKASSVGALTIPIESLFHKMGSLTEKANFLRSERKLRWCNLKSYTLRSRSTGTSKIPPVASRGDHGICCRPRWDLHDAGNSHVYVLSSPSVDVFKWRLDACWTEVYPNVIKWLNQSLHRYLWLFSDFSAMSPFCKQ